MNKILILAAMPVAGLLLGTFFFGGLWWTVRKAVTARYPALWFLGSSLLRTTLVLAGFYWLARGDWARVLLCLAGFIIARLVVLRLTRTKPEVDHAS